MHKDNKNLKFRLFLDIASLCNLGKVTNLKLTINLECYLFNFQIGKMVVLDVQLCLTLCDSMDYNLLSSSVHGVLQARILEWVAIPFSRGSSGPKDETWVSCIAG